MGEGATARRDPALIRTAAGLLALALWVGPGERPTARFASPLVPPVPAAPARAAVGAVTGTVRLTTTGGARAVPLSPYARPRYRPPAQPSGSPSSPETAVVYLVGGPAAAAAAPAPAHVIQRNRTIIPHVTVVQTGARVDFPNEDDVFHNIFSLSGPKHFNLGRYPPGASRSEVFAKPGVVRLFCDIHSEMSGVILVVNSPYFTHPDADGHFRIADVPEGEYTAVVWQEVAGADSTKVVVRAGAEAKVDFSLGG
jgi:plastocyanin